MGGGCTQRPAEFKTACPGRLAGSLDCGGSGGASCARASAGLSSKAKKLNAPTRRRAKTPSLGWPKLTRPAPPKPSLDPLRPRQDTKPLWHNCQHDLCVDRNFTGSACNDYGI